MKTRCRGCRTLIPFRETYCDNCKQKFNARRKDGLKDKQADDLLKTSRWRKTRADIIRRDGGVCQRCKKNGILAFKGLQVHHIVKRTQDMSLAFEHSNLVTVCRECHEIVELMTVEQQRALFGELESGLDFRL